MFIAYVIVAVVLALVLAASASLKLRRDRRAVEGIHESAGVPLSWFPYLAGCEIAGALGLIIGVALAPLGIAAAGAVIAYMIGAVITHLRAHDTKNIFNPIVPMALAVAALISRILSA